jgi:hypothetical protein
MRALFLFLLAANLALLAWSRLSDPVDAVTDPEPLRRQVQPEKIRVLPGAEVSSLPKAAAGTSAGAAAVPTAPVACIEWGGFALPEVQRAEQALEPLALGARLAQQRTEETAGWWVYIPPQGNRVAAMKKVAELKGFGIDEFFVVQDENPMRWAISLGVFRTEDAAKSRLEALKAKGIRSAVTGERETQVPKVWFQVRNAEPAVQVKLKELAQASPGTELRDCK